MILRLGSWVCVIGRTEAIESIHDEFILLKEEIDSLCVVHLGEVDEFISQAGALLIHISCDRSAFVPGGLPLIAKLIPECSATNYFSKVYLVTVKTLCFLNFRYLIVREIEILGVPCFGIVTGIHFFEVCHYTSHLSTLLLVLSAFKRFNLCTVCFLC